MNLAGLSLLVLMMSACGGGAGGNPAGNPAPGDPATPPVDSSLPGSVPELFTAANFPTTADPAPLGAIDLSKPAAVSVPALRMLTTDLPGSSTFESDIATAELAARAVIVAQIKAPVASKKSPIAHRNAAEPPLATGAEEGVVIAVLMDVVKDSPAGSVTKDTQSFQHDSVDGSVAFEGGGGTSADGTTSGVFAVDVKGKGNDKGVAATVGLQVAMSGKGNLCPDADGKVAFKIDFVAGAQGSAGAKTAGSKMEVSVSGTAYVNDAAHVSNADFEMRVQKSEQHPDSHNMFVDATFKGSFTAASNAASGMSGQLNFQRKFPDLSKVRMGSTTTLGEAFDTSIAMRNGAEKTVMGYLYALENRWRNGQCVEVIAPVPSTVSPGSTTSINASLRHKIEGVALHAPIDASLAGGDSLTPSRIDAAPGTFNYVAPDKKGNVATLTFSSTSRRGIGKLVASTSTDQAETWVGTFSTQFSGPPLNIPFRSSGSATFERDEAATQAAAAGEIVFKVKTGTNTASLSTQMIDKCTLSAPTVSSVLSPGNGTLTINTSNNTYRGAGFSDTTLTVTEACPAPVGSLTLPVPLIVWFYPDGSPALAADGKSFTGSRTETSGPAVYTYQWSFTKQ